LNVNLLGATKI